MIQDPICECGHSRTRHSRGGGCLAMVKVGGPVLPAYEVCDCANYAVNTERYTIGQLEQIREDGKDHV